MGEVGRIVFLSNSPSLTYEEYRRFYKEHYTPQNAITFFYGKMDIEKKLKALEIQENEN